MAARVQRALAWIAAVAGPVLLTALLLGTGTRQRDYVFLYLGLVSVIAVARGLLPGLLAALISFVLVDYYFVPPVGTLNIANVEDVVTLALFLGTAGLVGILASRLRQANVELLRLNREQAEAAELALRLARSEQQVQSLEQSSRERGELLANVSHDLRTPIATILTESTRMLQPESGDARPGLQTIASEARRLSALVGDTLDMARIEGTALDLQLEPVEIGDAIESAVSRLSRRSPSRQVDWVTAEAGINVLADWGRLGQVFDNLLANADRFAPPGTPIRIRVGEEPDSVTVRIIDSGPGVASEVRDRIFQRFVTSPAGRNGDTGGGTGLGLAIVHGIIEAHGGSVALEESGKEGTTFRFSLPRAVA